MRFHPPPTNAYAGDGLLYLPGLSLATPQYSCRIKWQAIYNTSVKADCTAETFSFPSFLGLDIGPGCLAGSQSPSCLTLMKHAHSLLLISCHLLVLSASPPVCLKNNQSHFSACCHFILKWYQTNFLTVVLRCHIYLGLVRWKRKLADLSLLTNFSCDAAWKVFVIMLWFFFLKAGV